MHAGVGFACAVRVLDASRAAQVTKAQLVQSLRQQSKGFQRASSQFRGVTRVRCPALQRWCSTLLPSRTQCPVMSSEAHDVTSTQLLICTLSGAAPEREVGGKDRSGHRKEIQVSETFHQFCSRVQCTGAYMHYVQSLDTIARSAQVSGLVRDRDRGGHRVRHGGGGAEGHPGGHQFRAGRLPAPHECAITAADLAGTC